LKRVLNSSFRLSYVDDLISYRLCRKLAATNLRRRRLAATNLRQAVGTDLNNSPIDFVLLWPRLY